MTGSRMTAAQYRAKALGTGNKYNAQRVEIDGIKFDSKRESLRYLVLKDRAKRGEISDLKLQVPVMLEGKNGEPLLTRTGRQMRLTVDFVYNETSTKRRVYEDAKGTPTRDYEVRRAVAAAMGIEVQEV